MKIPRVLTELLENREKNNTDNLKMLKTKAKQMSTKEDRSTFSLTQFVYNFLSRPRKISFKIIWFISISERWFAPFALIKYWGDIRQFPASVLVIIPLTRGDKKIYLPESKGFFTNKGLFRRCHEMWRFRRFHAWLWEKTSRRIELRHIYKQTKHRKIV